MSTTPPTTAQEALDLAWKLASEAQEGQANPEYTRYLEFQSLGLKEYSALRNRPQAHDNQPIPEGAGMSDTIEQVAKFLWECDQPGTTAKWREMAWREMAWNDMGGSESAVERQAYEIRAQTLADAGLLARTLPTREKIASTIYKHAETLTELPDGPVTCRGCGTPIDGYDLDSDLPSHQADMVLALLKGQDQ